MPITEHRQVLLINSTHCTWSTTDVPQKQSILSRFSVELFLYVQ